MINTAQLIKAAFRQQAKNQETAPYSPLNPEVVKDYKILLNKPRLQHYYHILSIEIPPLQRQQCPTPCNHQETQAASNRKSRSSSKEREREELNLSFRVELTPESQKSHLECRSHQGEQLQLSYRNY